MDSHKGFIYGYLSKITGRSTFSDRPFGHYRGHYYFALAAQRLRRFWDSGTQRPWAETPWPFYLAMVNPSSWPFFLPGRIVIISFYKIRNRALSGGEENPMKKEGPKSVTRIPWDNMPRQAEPPADRAKSRSPRGAGPGTADPAFSSIHAFFPFQATPSQSKEEK